MDVTVVYPSIDCLTIRTTETSYVNGTSRARGGLDTSEQST